jgi:YihY family inner membrane protein
MKTWINNLKATSEKILDRVRDVYHKVNNRTGGVPQIVRRTLENFSGNRSTQAAAGLAFYVFFSLFPLLLVLVAVASSFLREEAAFRQAVNFVSQAIPVSRSLIARNLETALERRTTVGSIGFVSALWSATNAFAILTQHVNRAWEQAQAPGFFKKRLLGLAMVGSLVLILLLSMIATTALQFIPDSIELPFGEINFFGQRLWQIGTRLSTPILTMLLLVNLYRWVPDTDVHWRPALWAGGVATVGWEIIRIAFTSFLSSGLLRYDLVYGSLAAVVALQFWIYLGATILLFGAYLSEAIQNIREGS